ncbi:glycosyltransferase family 4 protein [Magnetococcus sp. PR-3]|uniref:glycosyltransferase family 4 protein n=1 Tax=Magnetococcus sp. PR-3 TaxID=3120355 RepID=UPI002FCE4979
MMDCFWCINKSLYTHNYPDITSWKSIMDTLPTERPILVLMGFNVIVSGAEKMIFRTIQALTSSGMPVHVILNNWKHDTMDTAIEEAGGTWQEGPYNFRLRRIYPKVSDYFKLFFYLLRLNFFLLQQLLKHRPRSILMSNIADATAALPVLVLAKILGIQLILRSDNVPFGKRFYQLYWKYVLAKIMDKVIGVSQFCLNRLHQVGVPTDKSVLIYNVLVDDRFKSTFKQPHKNTTLEILYVGQILKDKGVYTVIHAVMHLLKQGYPLHLTLAGRIPDWPQSHVDAYKMMRDTVTQAGFDQQIQFIGASDNIAQLMAQSDLLLTAPTNEEAFGLVYLEAMALGLPVVTFNRGAITEIVRHDETGWICTEESLESLIEGTRYVLDHPDRRQYYSEQARHIFTCSDHPFSETRFQIDTYQLFTKP